MYSPAHYKTESEELTLKVVSENQFATLIAKDQISHLPLLLETHDGHGRLIGHMARMNPQWKTLPCETLAIFQGAHGYISPAWYDDNPDNVPTWNYVAVHVKGQARVIDTIDEVFETMQKLVTNNETTYQTGWQLQRNTDLEKLSKAIVAFEITDLEFNAKLKLSQKLEKHERENVIEKLEGLGNSSLAEWMRLTR